MKRLLISAVLALMLAPGAGAASAASFTHYSPPDPEKVDFVVNCFKATTGDFDPIVYPGLANSSHNHIFAGNLSVFPGSTPWTLGQNKTNCALSRNRSSYWAPRLYGDGAPIDPGQDRFQFRPYYRAGTTNLASVQTVPYGLRMIAGNSAATAPQSSSVAGYQCRNLIVGNTVPRQSLPPNCPRGDYLEASITFPNCWDGIRLDSTDHKSHMAYASATSACPADHPVRIPKIVLAMRYPTDGQIRADGSYKVLTLASHSTTNSIYTSHADVMAAWDPATMAMLVRDCIRASVGCADVSDGRLPPGDTLPADTTPTSP